MIRLAKTIWGVDDPLAEELIDGEPRLIMRLGPAENQQGPTFAGMIGYGVGPEVEALYGSAIMEAAFVAAVNLDTGGCAFGSVAPALAMPAAAARPDRPPAIDLEDDDGEATAAEVAGFDLFPLIGLPRDGCRHAVFAWLDDLLSDVAIVRAPDAGDPPGMPIDTPLLDPFAIAAAKCRGSPYFDHRNEAIILPDGAEGGPAAVFVVDGARRRVTTSSWLSFPASANGIRVAGYLRNPAPSPYSSRLVCYLVATGVHVLTLPKQG